MSRRKEKTISSNPTRFEVEQTEREEIASGPLAGALTARQLQQPQHHDSFATTEARLAHERHLRDTVPAIYEQVRQERRANQNAAALQGLVDDPAGRVAEAVYAQVFAATWVKRQDLSAERKCTAARSEASTASTMARSAYAAEIKGTIEVGA